MTDLRTDYLAARRDSIRSAAERVFVRHGFDGATVQEIADEAGVSAGSIYRYFTSKDDLIRAVAEACGNRYAAQFDAVGATTSSPYEVLLAAGARIWEAIPSEQARQDAVLTLEATLVAARAPELAEPMASSIGDMRTRLETLIALAQSDGALDATIDASALAVLLIAATGGMQTLALQLGASVDIAASWHALEQLLAGLQSREDRA